MQKISILLLSALLFLSCERKLEDINSNPNAPEEVSPQFLLSNVLWEAGNQNSIQGWTNGNLIAQHTSNIEFLPADRYDLGSNTGYWNHLYHLLNDIQSMQAAAPENDAYAAVGNILRAWVASQLTDMWGDVPFSESISGASDNNWTPAYDTQEEIYTGSGGILELLRNAVTTLDATGDRLEGDILYSGDLDKWIRLANSLRIRYLLRISKQSSVSTEMQDILTTNRLMTGNVDNGAVPYLGAAPNQWIIFTEREGRYTDVRMSFTIDSTYDALSDPRNAVLFKPTVASGTDFKGLPNGLSRDSQTAFDLSDISLTGAFFRDIPDGPDANFMHYAELQFALAEAAFKGFIAGNASDYYQEGIRASFEYYGLTVSASYLSDPAVDLASGNELEKIMTQKWLALFLNGHEAWFNIRRTGLPALSIPVDNLNNDLFPVRYRYPESEQAVNSANYSDAVARIGGDDLNRSGWWEQ